MTYNLFPENLEYFPFLDGERSGVRAVHFHSGFNPMRALSHDDAKAYQEATLTQYPTLVGWYARWWQSH